MSGVRRRLVTALREGGWLDRSRAGAYAAILLGCELLTFLFLIAGTHGLVVPLVRPTTTDFASFYAAGMLADAGTPQLAYDQAAHYAAEQLATEPGIPYVFFYYPPVYLLLCAVLARLPYLLAFVFFEAVTLVAWVLVGRRILAVQGWMALVPLLAFPAVFWNLGLGQNAFLTAALLGMAMLLVDRRPVVAGLLFGAICYKPHFGLLVPVALAAGRRWQAFAAAALSATVLILLSLACFGWETWREFLVAAAGSHATYQSGRIDFSGIASPFGGLRLLGVAPPAAYAIQAAATAAAAALVWVAWRRRLGLAVRAAALAAGTVVAAPVVLIYDLLLGGVAMAWLIRAARDSGFLPWEKLSLAALFVLPLLSRNIGAAWHIPMTAFFAAAMLILVARRVRHEMTANRHVGVGLTLAEAGNA